MAADVKLANTKRAPLRWWPAGARAPRKASNDIFDNSFSHAKHNYYSSPDNQGSYDHPGNGIFGHHDPISHVNHDYCGSPGNHGTYDSPGDGNPDNHDHCNNHGNLDNYECRPDAALDACRAFSVCTKRLEEVALKLKEGIFLANLALHGKHSSCDDRDSRDDNPDHRDDPNSHANRDYCGSPDIHGNSDSHDSANHDNQDHSDNHGNLDNHDHTTPVCTGGGGEDTKNEDLLMPTPSCNEPLFNVSDQLAGKVRFLERLIFELLGPGNWVFYQEMFEAEDEEAQYIAAHGYDAPGDFPGTYEQNLDGSAASIAEQLGRTVAPQETAGHEAEVARNLSPPAVAADADEPSNDVQEECESLGDDSNPYVLYVCKKMLEDLSAKLKTGTDVVEADFRSVMFPEKIPDSEIMVPVDMRCVGEEFEDVEAMVTKLGAKGAAHAFIKAKQHFDENTDKEPDEVRPKPMTAKEWRQNWEESLCEFDWSDRAGLFELDTEEDMEEAATARTYDRVKGCASGHSCRG